MPAELRLLQVIAGDVFDRGGVGGRHQLRAEIVGAAVVDRGADRADDEDQRQREGQPHVAGAVAAEFAPTQRGGRMIVRCIARLPADISQTGSLYYSYYSASRYHLRKKIGKILSFSARSEIDCRRKVST